MIEPHAGDWMECDPVIGYIFPEVRRETGLVVLNWPVELGRSYSVYSTLGVTAGFLVFEAGPFPPAVGVSEMNWTDTNGISDPKAYVVEVTIS